MCDAYSEYFVCCNSSNPQHIYVLLLLLLLLIQLYRRENWGTGRLTNLP